MKYLRPLSNFFLFIVLFLFVSANVFAETNWEVAIIFLDSGVDVADNLKEIQSITPSPNLTISVFQEDLSALPHFLDQAYRSQASKKSLIIYSHGLGPRGLQNISTKELKETILSHTPHLDILWFDACFMANIEFLYELRSQSTYTIASEDAEFTAGMPFQTLEQLPSTSSVTEAVLMLGKNFIDSYSYLKEGAQRNYVSSSSSTISIFENNKWDKIVYTLQQITAFTKNLAVDSNRLHKIYSMENKELVDLGQLLISMRTENKLPALDSLLTNAIRLLNIQSVQRLRSNPRVKIHNPENTSLMVFGFNNWTVGSLDDFSSNNVLDKIVAHDNFILGPLQKKWPYKKEVVKNTIFTPFAPGINVFNYYFLNENATKLLTNSQAIYRMSDVVEMDRENSDSPLVYSAYTQEIGKRAERYTGLSITFPGTVPTLDYFELEFNQNVHWLNL